MDALLFGLALEVVLLQMRILKGTEELRIFNKNESKPQKAQIEKLERNRKTLKVVIRRTLVEIVEDGEWGTLQQAVQILHENSYNPVRLHLEHERLRKARAEVVNELNIKQSQWTLELQNADRKVAIIRDKIKDDLKNANARISYVEKWLFARHESLELEQDAVPRAPAAPRFSHENRVHEELLRAYELQIQELGQSLEHWKERYSTDTTAMYKCLKEKCEQLRVTTARRQELQKLYDLHAGEMRAWLTFKRERAARLAREQRLNAAAKRVQAWWRGVMVRRALGQFRHLKNMKKTPSKSKKK